VHTAIPPPSFYDGYPAFAARRRRQSKLPLDLIAEVLNNARHGNEDRDALAADCLDNGCRIQFLHEGDGTAEQ
jgi:hypothetical protein